MEKVENTNYVAVTEIAGDEVTTEQVNRIFNRYYWTKSYCQNKDVLEVACGAGQGLGFLLRISNNLTAGDFSYEILLIAKGHYKNRVDICRYDAQHLPYKSESRDVIILFEAIYYLQDAEQFVKECTRVLRPGGRVLLATANKDLYDFNPSPHSFTYFGVLELKQLFLQNCFRTEFFGDTPVGNISMRQKILRPLKKVIVSMGFMPRSMAGKKFLKRLVFGNFVHMPAEIGEDTVHYVKPSRLDDRKPDNRHKVIYCAATLKKETEYSR